MRNHVLATTRSIRHLQKAGLSSKDAHLQVALAGFQKKLGVSVNPAKLEKTAAELKKYLLTKTRKTPLSLAKQQIALRITAKKRARIEKLFGEGGLRIVMIKPEANHMSRQVLGRLKSLGFTLVLAKSVVFTPQKIESIYSHIIKMNLENPAKAQGFYLVASRLMVAPSRVFVVIPPATMNDEEIVNAKKALRKVIGGDTLNSAFPKTDAIAFDPLASFNGIHSPEGHEIVRDANVLLDAKDITRIENRMRSLR